MLWLTSIDPITLLGLNIETFSAIYTCEPDLAAFVPWDDGRLHESH
jgi:hypothetical protein